MQDGCQFYMDLYIASNGVCFKAAWAIFKNHLLEVGLAQNWHSEVSQPLIYYILSYAMTPYE